MEILVIIFLESSPKQSIKVVEMISKLGHWSIKEYGELKGKIREQRLEVETSIS